MLDENNNFKIEILGYNKKIIIEKILNTSTNKNNEELTESDEEEEIEIEIFDDIEYNIDEEEVLDEYEDEIII